MGLLLKLFEELVAHIADKRKVALGVALHELTNHRLVVVFWHEPTDDEIVGLRREPLLPVPVQQFRIVIGQLALPRLGTIGDVRGPWIVLAVLVVDVLLDVLAVADEQVAVLGHHPLGDLPVLAHWRAPFGAHPLMPVRVDVQLPAQLMDDALEMRGERSDSAGQDIDNRMRYTVPPDVGDAIIQGGHIIVDGLRRPDIGDLHLEAVGVVIDEAAFFLRLARHVVFERRLMPVVFGQLVDECLIAAVVAGNALRSHNEHMLRLRVRQGSSFTGSWYLCSGDSCIHCHAVTLFSMYACRDSSQSGTENPVASSSVRSSVEQCGRGAMGPVAVA